MTFPWNIHFESNITVSTAAEKSGHTAALFVTQHQSPTSQSYRNNKGKSLMMSHMSVHLMRVMKLINLSHKMLGAWSNREWPIKKKKFIKNIHDRKSH